MNEYVKAAFLWTVLGLFAAGSWTFKAAKQK